MTINMISDLVSNVVRLLATIGELHPFIHLKCRVELEEERVNKWKRKGKDNLGL
jgi:ribosomal protein S16